MKLSEEQQDALRDVTALVTCLMGGDAEGAEAILANGNHGGMLMTIARVMANHAIEDGLGPCCVRVWMAGMLTDPES